MNHEFVTVLPQTFPGASGQMDVKMLLQPNGPAIWGGCVTRRKHRAGSWYFSKITVTVQGGYGALFAVMVQILLRIGAIAVQV